MEFPELLLRSNLTNAEHPYFRSIIVALVVAVGYATFGKLALVAVSGAGDASPIWPAAGLALAAVLLFGNWVSIGVFIGSYILNVMLGDPFSTNTHFLSFCIAMGATLQAVFGAYLVRRFVGFPTPLDEPGVICRFFLSAGPIASVVSPTVGTAILFAVGKLSIEETAQSWGIWWLGDTLGVIVFAPVVLCLGMKELDFWNRRKGPICISMLITITSAALVFHVAMGLEKDRVALAFQDRAKSVDQLIGRALAEAMNGLHDIQNFVRLSEHITRQEYAFFANSVLGRIDGLHAISLNLRVHEHDKAAFERQMRSTGVPGFKIWEIPSELSGPSPVEAYESVVVSYIEPLESNRPALGLDVASNPTRRAALHTARDTGQPTMTERLTLVQGTREDYGVLVFLPVYNTQTVPSNMADRRSELYGYIVGVFSFGAVIENAMSGTGVDDVDITILDRSAPAETSLLYPKTELPAHLARVRRLESSASGVKVNPWTSSVMIADRAWEIQIRPTPKFNAANRLTTAWFILVGCLIFASVISIVVLIVTGRQRVIEGLVNQRTAELVDKTMHLEHIKTEAERANQAKTDFLASMSHDLRTPLNAILGFTDMMRVGVYGDLGNPKYKGYVEDIHRSGSHLIALIDDILDVSKIEAGKFVLSEDRIQIHPLIQRSMRQLDVIAASSNIRLNARIAPHMQDLWADEKILTQILNNLLSNAVKFTGVDGQVNVSTQTDADDAIVIKVSDTGCGMASDEIARALNAFEQIHNPYVSDVHKGTGLGLHICTQLMDLLGGKLEIESAIGKGTTVTLRFPPKRTIDPIARSDAA